jgi:polar amino acid transport system permease protein
MSIDLSLFRSYGPQLLHGLELTVLVWVLGSAIGLAAGFLVGIVGSLGRPRLTIPIRLYIELIRGTPLLVQLFIVYYGGPAVGIALDALTVGILGLGVYGGAYFAEIFRAGLASIPRGQLEAARAFGMRRRDRIRYILLPQMLVLVVPPITNMLIILLKDTAVLSIVTVPELTFEVTGMSVETFAFVEPFLVLAVVYWGLTELTAYCGRRADTPLRRLPYRLTHGRAR